MKMRMFYNYGIASIMSTIFMLAGCGSDESIPLLTDLHNTSSTVTVTSEPGGSAKTTAALTVKAPNGSSVTIPAGTVITPSGGALPAGPITVDVYTPAAKRYLFISPTTAWDTTMLKGYVDVRIAGVPSFTASGITITFPTAFCEPGGEEVIVNAHADGTQDVLKGTCSDKMITVTSATKFSPFANPIFQNKLWWFGTPNPTPPFQQPITTFTPLNTLPGWIRPMYGWYDNFNFETCVLGLSSVTGRALSGGSLTGSTGGTDSTFSFNRFGCN